MYEEYTLLGDRVIALAYKTIPKYTNIENLDRHEAEKDLVFAGFYICESPLKPDSKHCIEIL